MSYQHGGYAPPYQPQPSAPDAPPSYGGHGFDQPPSVPLYGQPPAATGGGDPYADGQNRFQHIEKPRCRDMFWLLLWLAQLVTIVALCINYGKSFDWDSIKRGNSSSAAENGVSYTSAVAIGGSALISIGLSAMWVHFMKVRLEKDFVKRRLNDHIFSVPSFFSFLLIIYYYMVSTKNIILQKQVCPAAIMKFSMGAYITMLLAMAIVAFVYEIWALAVIYIVVGLLTVLFFFCARNRIKFAEAVLGAACAGLQANCGAIVISYLMVLVQIVW